jgi:uncharacterized protein
VNHFKAAVWNRHERRVRAGWRLLVQMILFILVQVVLVQVVLAVLAGTMGKTPASTVAVIVLYPVLGAGLIWLVARFIDRRRVADYGFHLNSSWWKNFSFGFVLGAALMTGIFLTERLAGWITVAPAQTKSGFAPALAVMLSLVFYSTVACMEEFTFRGYQLRNLAEGLVSRRIVAAVAIVAALLMSSAVFGLLHATNSNATAVSTVNIMLAGILLALPFVLTGELAISIGLHLSWNFFQGTVYGFPVSGSPPSRRLLNLEQSGPELWTGGAFGPEGGLLGIAATTIGCALVLAWVRFRLRNLAVNTDLARYEPPQTKVAGSDMSSDV